MRAASLLVLVVSILLLTSKPAAQAIPIGIIDFYGLNGMSVDSLKPALTFKAGDSVFFEGKAPLAFTASEAQLAKLPEVQRARISMVCCDNGRAIVYVGIERRGTKPLSFRAAPDGTARLPADVVQAGEEFSKALTRAAERGDTTEDRSQGHALNRDPALRAIQDRFVGYAKRDLPALRNVARTSSNAAHRSLALQVLAYAADKKAILDDLLYGMSDPDPDVRNSATRALMVLGEMTPTARVKAPAIPAAPFIALINSLSWMDRNKASLALDTLTRGRDPALLDALRRQALSALVEIARWKSDGHAMPGFFILARIAGYVEEAAFVLWKRGEREVVIRAAIARR